jgi:hypothetical protein
MPKRSRSRLSLAPTLPLRVRHRRSHPSGRATVAGREGRRWWRRGVLAASPLRLPEVGSVQVTTSCGHASASRPASGRDHKHARLETRVRRGGRRRDIPPSQSNQSGCSRRRRLHPHRLRREPIRLDPGEFIARARTQRGIHLVERLAADSVSRLPAEYRLPNRLPKLASSHSLEPNSAQLKATETLNSARFSPEQGTLQSRLHRFDSGRRL